MAVTGSSMLIGSTGGIGNLGTLYVRFAADVTGLNKGFQSAERMIIGGSASIAKSATLAAAAITGLALAATAEFAKFEHSFADVRKTVSATEQEFKQFESTFRKMATQMPTNVNEINKIAAAAGQLGIQKEHIADFTKVMINLGNTTNLKGEAAAQQLARLANITQMSQKDFGRLGSTISELDRKSATTAAEIVTLSLRIGGAARAIGMSNDQILGFAASLSSVGIAAEAGGTAISETMINMQKAVSMGTKELETFATVAGMSISEFKKLFGENSAEAILQFVEGLRRIEDVGGDAFRTLDRLGMDGARITRTLISAAQAGKLFRENLGTAKEAWKENTSLTEMADERYKTFISQLRVTGGMIRELAIQLGEAMAPGLRELNEYLQGSLTASDGWAASLISLARNAIPEVVGAVKSLNAAMPATKMWFEDLWTMTKMLGKGDGFIAGVANATTHAAEQIRYNNLSMADKLKEGAFKNGFKPFRNELSIVGAPGRGSFMTGGGKIGGVGRATPNLPDPFETEGFFMGKLEIKAEDTAKAIEKITNETAKLAKTLREVNSDKVTDILDKLDAPKMTDMMTGQYRGMSKAEMGLGAMSGIPGMDYNTQQALMIQTELETNKHKIDELKKLGEMEGNLTEEVQKRKLEALEMYNKRATQLQMAQYQMMTSSFASIGDSMLQIGSAFFGKQTGMYKAMFAASKAFAIADSTVKIMQGVANAASLPWPLNLGAIASVVAATANIVSTIQSVKLEFGGARRFGGGVEPGKSFLVGEAGPELFSPSRAGHIIPNDRLMGGGSNVVINNQTEIRPEVTTREQGGEEFIEIMFRRMEERIGSNMQDGTGPVVKSLDKVYNVRRRGGQ